jgi:hypothetical protein
VLRLTIVKCEQQCVRHDGLKRPEFAAMQERHRQHDREKQQDCVEQDLH